MTNSVKEILKTALTNTDNELEYLNYSLSLCEHDVEGYKNRILSLKKHKEELEAAIAAE